MKPLNRPQIKKFLKKNVSARPDFDLVFLLQNFDNAANVGHMFRLADAVGAELVMTGKTPMPPNQELEITSMGQERRVPYRHFPKLEEGVQTLKSEGYTLVSVELTENAELYSEYDYPNKLCLVLGNEKTGVYPYALSHSDGVVYIPMYGKNYSLNVHVSAAIVAYEVMSKERE